MQIKLKHTEVQLIVIYISIMLVLCKISNNTKKEIFT